MNLRYLVDTDWVINYLRAHPAIVSRLGELQPQGLACPLSPSRNCTRAFFTHVIRTVMDRISLIFCAV